MSEFVYIVVSQYQRNVDHYGGRMSDWDIHDVYTDAKAAEQFLVTADKNGPDGYPRTYSIVQRPLNTTTV